MVLLPKSDTVCHRCIVVFIKGLKTCRSTCVEKISNNLTGI